jgi:hypothetical protein
MAFLTHITIADPRVPGTTVAAVARIAGVNFDISTGATDVVVWLFANEASARLFGEPIAVRRYALGSHGLPSLPQALASSAEFRGYFAGLDSALHGLLSASVAEFADAEIVDFPLPWLGGGN